ncbi:(2Fe-2S) ferredoxin domain-containing protein [Cellulosilyticum sp. I15G10I2]|uniref:(2Fe-2S) ferredoxin domain-containing protein n=1 Tax=Cellulosilyticum sp. I15G10I2 TaxID=1892843 RepID=UPI00085C298F|nr:(2Fe-2S) ferredoxin domain-containing protein [Cellulosilyticum sp. I15G10I2]
MKTIKICIGSACHLKGSYQVIEIFKALIKEHQLENIIELHAAFCIGRCTGAVSVARWDDKILSVSKDNAREIFIYEIMAYL